MHRPSVIWQLAAALACALAASPGAWSQPRGLPAGDGREQVERFCNACHRTDRIPRSAGYSRSGWAELIGTMVDLSATPDVHRAITGYLARHFPPSDLHAPRLVPGPVQVRFREWTVPTLGQRARDPIQAEDGSIWWAGQWGNLVGRIDPATGAMREYPLPPGSRPHSVTLDRAGRVWYTGNGNGTVGKLDAATGAITVFRMPDPAARDPHTAIFDRTGILWFTLQQSNMVGRLDPATGDVRLASMPRPGAKPYGIKVDREGVPWVACNGGNCLVRVDPESMALTEIALPDPRTTVRRLDIAADGVIWYVNSSLGRLGRFDPRSGTIREWPSPSGPRSHPYAIAVVDGVVWYDESGERPDALVRFDPRDESFQSWPIPSGGIYAGIVRHMRATREGNLLIHQSATNRIILVEPTRPAR